MTVDVSIIPRQGTACSDCDQALDEKVVAGLVGPTHLGVCCPALEPALLDPGPAPSPACGLLYLVLVGLLVKVSVLGVRTLLV